jgi:hypothetical protein
MSYVIFVSSEFHDWQMSSNSYGYYMGQIYSSGGVKYPHCMSQINEYTKRYKRRANAEKMAEKIFDRCGFVAWARVEEIED